MPYCTYTDVQNELGLVFTSDQQTQCTALIAQGDDWINTYTGRVWATTTAITDELHAIEGRFFYIDRAPIGSLTTVKVRSQAVGATQTTLTSGTDYELLSAAQGIIALASDYEDAYALVSYTPAVTVPGRIVRASVLLASAWMGSRLSDVPVGVKRYEVGNELVVEMADGSVSAVPSSVTDILAGSRRFVFA